MKRRQWSLTAWRESLHDWLARLITQNWVDIGLRAKMSAIVSIGLTGLLAIFAYVAIASMRQSTQQLLNEHVLRARILAGTLDSHLAQAAGLLTVLSSRLDMQNPEAALGDAAEVFKEDFRGIQGIYLFDSGSNLLAGTSTMQNVNWKEVPGLQLAAGGEPRSISLDGLPRPYAVIAVPVMHPPSEVPSGVLAAVLDLSDPNIFLSSSSLELESNGTIQVLDGLGHVVVSSPPDRALSASTLQKITSQLFQKGQPMVEACLGCTGNELDDSGTIIAFAPLSEARWGVVVWHNSQEVFAPVRQLAFQTLILGTIAMLGALGLVLVTTRSVIVPVQILTDATRRISEAQQDTSTLEAVQCTLTSSLSGKVARRDEIGILSNGFATMCRRLRESMEEIRLWNRELDDRVQARTRQLSTVNAVALTVNQSLNLSDILNRALDEVLQLASIDMAAIYLQHASTGELELMACRGLSREAARLAHYVGLLDSSCGGVVETGRTVSVPDISSYRGRGADSLRRERITALVHVPLMTKGLVLGSLCVGTRGQQAFQDEDQQLLTAIGSQIAIAVENARLYAEVQLKERVRSKLFKKALAAQEDERKRIARELHDEVSQSLTALLYRAEGGLETDSTPESRERLQSICDLTQHTLDNIHKLIFDLRPSILDQLGLIPALRWLAENRLKAKGVHVRVEASSTISPLNAEADIQRLSPDVETGLFRVVQEAVANIARHAAARNVEIRLELGDRAATVTIIDDGIGFDLAELSKLTIDLEDRDSISAENVRGLGIIGMQERIELLGGDMEIRTAPGGGTQIRFRVPILERDPAYD